MYYGTLRGRIKQLYGSDKEFSRHIGRSASTVSYKLSGRLQLSATDIETWAEALRIQPGAMGVFFEIE